MIDGADFVANGSEGTVTGAADLAASGASSKSGERSRSDENFLNHVAVDGFLLADAAERHGIETKIVDVARNSTRIFRNHRERAIGEKRHIRFIASHMEAMLDVGSRFSRIQGHQPRNDRHTLAELLHAWRG